MRYDSVTVLPLLRFTSPFHFPTHGDIAYLSTMSMHESLANWAGCNSVIRLDHNSKKLGSDDLRGCIVKVSPLGSATPIT